MSNAPYRVYHLNVFVKSFSNRDAALDYVARCVRVKGQDFGDFEILDKSDAL